MQARYLLLTLLPLTASAQAKSMLNIGAGDALVLTRDLELPANVSVLGNFDVRTRARELGESDPLSRYGCALVLSPATHDRLLPKGTRLVFSGVNRKEVTQGEDTPHFQSRGVVNPGLDRYNNSAGVKGSSSVRALRCYGTYQGLFREYQSYETDLYLLRLYMQDYADFVPAPPVISD